MPKLTDAALRAVVKNPPKNRRDLADGTVTGLMVRVGPGSATWSLKLRVVGEGGISKRGHKKKGKEQRVSLGEYPALSIERARALANTFLDQANGGVSPAAALESGRDRRRADRESLVRKVPRRLCPDERAAGARQIRNRFARARRPPDR